MVGKANADDGGKDRRQSKAGRAPSMPMARDPAAAVAEEYEAARRKERGRRSSSSLRATAMTRWPSRHAPS